jgi:[ribosomal protein S5]-alanine N-acetyltransferase
MITAERIILQELKDKDWESIHSYASLEAASRFQPWGPNTILDTKNFVRQAVQDMNVSPRKRNVFSVFEKGNSEMIGHCELNIDGPSAELSYIIHPDHWGKGFATELSMTLVRYGFEELGLHRIIATCDVRNIGSYRVLEKVGMTREGRLRKDLLIKDGWRDSYLYGILEEEWK